MTAVGIFTALLWIAGVGVLCYGLKNAPYEPDEESPDRDEEP